MLPEAERKAQLLESNFSTELSVSLLKETNEWLRAERNEDAQHATPASAPPMA